jgi:hypothetical protein
MAVCNSYPIFVNKFRAHQSGALYSANYYPQILNQPNK